jgi:hypothetical protein
LGDIATMRAIFLDMDTGDQGPYLAAAEKKSGKGSYVICQLQLNKRVKSNPVAKIFSLEMIFQRQANPL